MLRLIGRTSEPESRLLLDEYYKVNIEWGETYSADHVYWQLSTDKNMLRVGINLSSGSLASIATPIAQSQYDPEATFTFMTASGHPGVPVFDVSRFIEKDSNIVTEAIPFSMTVNTHQILIDFPAEAETVSCIASERASFFADQNGFLTKILCQMTGEEMKLWRQYFLPS